MQDKQAVIEALERSPRIIIPLVKEVPEAVLRRRPAPKKWSAHEHACHLSRVHPLFFDRLDLMLRDPKPRITPYNPAADEPEDALLKMDLGACLDRFARDRETLVGRLKGLKPADWERAAEHPEYKRYTMFIMFRHLALHDMLHAYRIEELLLKPEWD